jgi:hypothetical protein
MAFKTGELTMDMDNENTNLPETPSDEVAEQPPEELFADVDEASPETPEKKKTTVHQPNPIGALMSIALGVVLIFFFLWLYRSDEEVRLTWVDDVATVLEIEDIGHYDTDDEWVAEWYIRLLYITETGEEKEIWDTTKTNSAFSIGEEAAIIRAPDESSFSVRERPKEPGWGWVVAFGIAGLLIFIGLHEFFMIAFHWVKRFLSGHR